MTRATHPLRNRMLLTPVLFLVFQAANALAIIHDKDDRIEPWENRDPIISKAFAATATMILDEKIRLKADGFVELLGLASKFANRACPGENFVEQPANGSCSGVLVAPDVILTAGHCLAVASDPVEACRKMNWTFDYFLSAPSQKEIVLRKTQLYRCAGIVGHQSIPVMSGGTIVETRADYVMIKLDRKVEGRGPVNVKWGKPDENLGRKVFAVGSPRMLPKKISINARVFSRDEIAQAQDILLPGTPHPLFLSTNLDVSNGSSGGPVFLTDTGELIGIVSSGVGDRVERKLNFHPFRPFLKPKRRLRDYKLAVSCHSERVSDSLKAISEKERWALYLEAINPRIESAQAREDEDEVRRLQGLIGDYYDQHADVIAGATVYHVGTLVELLAILKAPILEEKVGKFDLTKYEKQYSSVLAAWKHAAANRKPVDEIWARVTGLGGPLNCWNLDPRTLVQKRNFPVGLQRDSAETARIGYGGQNAEAQTSGDGTWLVSKFVNEVMEREAYFRIFSGGSDGFFVEMSSRSTRKGSLQESLKLIFRTYVGYVQGPSPLPSHFDARDDVSEVIYCPYDSAFLAGVQEFPTL